MARRFNRGMALRPVNRIKHVVDFNGQLTAGSQIDFVIVVANDDPSLGQTTQVATASKVNGIYLKIEVASNDTPSPAVIPNVYLSVFKNPGGQLVPPPPNNVGASAVKKYVIHQEMIMIQNEDNGNPRILFNGVIKFPRGYIRNGPLDEWQLSILSPGVDCNLCLQCHYKEFR